MKIDKRKKCIFIRNGEIILKKYNRIYSIIDGSKKCYIKRVNSDTPVIKVFFEVKDENTNTIDCGIVTIPIKSLGFHLGEE